MDRYVYKVYGAYFNTGYEIILKDTDIQKVYSVLQNNEYSKIMVVRYNVLQNMDEIVTVKHNNSFTRKLKKKGK